RIDERDQDDFGRNGIAQTQRRGDGGVEFLPRAIGNQISFEKLADDWTHAIMNYQFGDDQQRHRHQQTRVGFYVHKEWELDGVAPRVALQRGEYQERKPGNAAEHEQAAFQQFQDVAAKVCPAKELIQGTA